MRAPHAILGLLALVGLSPLLACQHDASFVWVDALEAEALTPQPYRLRAGDDVSVRVWSQDSLATDTRVRPDGRITVPLIGDVMLAGLTPHDASEVIRQRLDGIVLEPKVTVTVQGVRPYEVMVLGEVKTPGRYVITEGDTVLHVLAKAGGLSEYASSDAIYVVRRVPRKMRVRFSYDDLVRGAGRGLEFPLQDGDIIAVE